MGRWWIICAAGALVVGLAACTSIPDTLAVREPSVSGQADRRVQALIPSPRIENTAASNRLLVLGDDGNIYIVRPDGGERRALSSDAGPAHVYLQPTWSPSSDRVAWVEATSDGDEVKSSSLHVRRTDGSSDIQVGTTAPPFYLFWSPDGSRLAYLADGSQGLDLALFDPGNGGNPIRVLDQGAPLYFSWAPDGQRLLTHVGPDRLGLVALDGTQTALAGQPAGFAAPRWGPDGVSLVYAIVADGEQRLVLADLKGVAQRSLASFKGNVSFGLRPDGQQVAYVDTLVPVPTAAFGPLYVTGLASGTVQPISEGPVLAFFWSPDSNYLLYLVLEQAGAPSNGTKASFRAQQDQPVWTRWHMWDGQRSVSFERFLPSQTMLLDYLRFFDQYAQSMILWAPDSSAFTYAGTSVSGEDGIWVQPRAEAAAAVRVGSGVMATWSPR